MDDLCLTPEWKRRGSRCGCCMHILLVSEWDCMYSESLRVCCLFVFGWIVCALWGSVGFTSSPAFMCPQACVGSPFACMCVCVRAVLLAIPVFMTLSVCLSADVPITVLFVCVLHPCLSLPHCTVSVCGRDWLGYCDFVNFLHLHTLHICTCVSVTVFDPKWLLKVMF